MHRICVWNTAFLGDAVLTLPLISSLAKAWPDAEIDFWVRSGVESLFAAQPELCAAIPVSKRGKNKGVRGLFRVMAALRRGAYDLLLCPHTSSRSAFAALGSGIATRIGYSGGLLRSLAFNRRVPRRFGELDEVERLLELLKPLHMPYDSAWPKLVLPNEVRDKADSYWRRQGLEDVPVLGMHPGSVWPTKRWPASRFGRVAAMAAQEGVRILVFAGPGEEPLARDLILGARRTGKAAEQACINLAGKLSLPELAAYIGRLDCYLCNDSGPMHLAWAQKVPLVALFGPTVRALGFYPRGEKSVVLEKNLPCRPCGKHGGNYCREGTHACMRSIETHEVWQAVRTLLFSRTPAFLEEGN